MSHAEPRSADPDHVYIVRHAFAAALRGDFENLREVLAEDVRWHGAGEDPSFGCNNRREALTWIGETVARGSRAEVIDVRPVDEDRVLVLLARKADDGELSPPHGQIVTFRGDKVREILVYPSEEAAIEAVGGR